MDIFHLFPLLPTELRLKIWQLVLCTPRAVTITVQKAPFHRRTPEIPRIVKSFSSDPPVPPLMHACSESRLEALPFYTQSFITAKSRTYISFDFDVLHMADSVITSVPPNALRRIRYMVLDVADCEYFEFYNMEYIVQMSELKTLDLFVERGIQINWGIRDRYVAVVVNGFEETRETFKAWECPRVRILHKKTRQELACIEGGAKVPGWTPESQEDVIL